MLSQPDPPDRRPERPRPAIDRDSADWWAAVRRHELLIQRCADCAAARFPPRAVCDACHSRAWSWTPARGTGRVVSWTVTHQPIHPAFADEVPYTVLHVALDDAPGLLCWGNLVTAPPETLRADLPVEAVFTDIAEDLTLVQWRPTGQSA